MNETAKAKMEKLYFPFLSIAFPGLIRLSLKTYFYVAVLYWKTLTSVLLNLPSFSFSYALPNWPNLVATFSG